MTADLAQKGRVLVVDDDASLAEMLTIVLRQEGFESRVCGRGDEAMEAFRRLPSGPGAARPDAARQGRHRRLQGDPRGVRRPDRDAHRQERHRRRGGRARVRGRRLRRQAVQAQGARRPDPRAGPPPRRAVARGPDDRRPQHRRRRPLRDPRRHAGQPHAAGVRPPPLPGPQALAGVHPRGAARAGLGLPALRRHPAGQRARPAAPLQGRARPREPRDHRDGARGGLQGRRA